MSGASLRPAVLAGTVRAPPSKSYTHRALLVAHLGRRPFRIEGPLDADDTRASARAIGRLGTRIVRSPGSWEAQPRPLPSSQRPVSIDCRESGTTLRFVLALAALDPRRITLTGVGRLPGRPIRELVRALRSLGAQSRRRSRSRNLPLEIRGPIHGGSVTVDASESSQFASALLFVLPTREEDSLLRLVGPIVSRPYIEATLEVVRRHGIVVEGDGRRFRIAGGQSYTGRRFAVPGDASSAAGFWVGAAISGGRVRVDGIDPSWPQADLAILRILGTAGATVHRSGRSVTVEAGRRRPFSVDLTASPDLFPLVGVLAAATPGRSRLRGAAQIVHKESDRRRETVRLVRAMGAGIREGLDVLEIDGRSDPAGVSLPDLSDHRMVMAAAVAALAGRGRSTVGDVRAVGKSFPRFWSAWRAVGGMGT